MSESEMRSKVEHTLSRQSDFLQTVQIEDYGKRAERLIPHLDVGNVSNQRASAEEALEICGEAALPALRRLLLADDPPSLVIIDLIAKCHGPGCKALCELLRKDAKAWRADAPKLNLGWSTAIILDSECIRRQLRLHADRKALDALRTMEIGVLQRRAAVPPVEDFEAVWVANAVLSSEEPRILKECDNTLERFRAP
jgi:hypothetical protein